MSRICSSIALTKSFDGASPTVTKGRFLRFTMIMLVEDILGERKPLQKFCSVDFIGPPYSVIHMIIAKPVIVVNDYGESQNRMRCLNTQS